VRGRTTAAVLAVVLLACGVAVRPTAVLADPRDDEPAAERIDPDYAAGKAALDAKNWGAAIRLLFSAALRDTRNADIQNYLGYAYRNDGRLELAFRHYQRALELNPRHRGAHEYIGEAYLIANDLANAEKHLAALEKICLIPCEEYDDLKKAVAEHRRRATK
jgi:Flp pilus assembly protein TadD